MNDNIRKALEAFIVNQQAAFAAREANRDPRLAKTTIGFEVGKKYARIYTYEHNPEARSAFGFMDIKTGDLYKAASWKAPAKNFPRGNVLTIGTRTFVYSIG